MKIPLYRGEDFTETLYQQAFSIVAAEESLKKKKKAETMGQKLKLFFSMCVVLFLLGFIFLLLWFVGGRVDVYQLVLVCTNLLIGAMDLRIVLMLKKSMRSGYAELREVLNQHSHVGFDESGIALFFEEELRAYFSWDDFDCCFMTDEIIILLLGDEDEPVHIPYSPATEQQVLEGLSMGRCDERVMRVRITKRKIFAR